MSKEQYNVSLIFSADWGVDVEAESPEDAAEKAYNSNEASVSLCHQCAEYINIGDCIRVIVYDESGKEVLDDGYENLANEQLRAENAALKEHVKVLTDALEPFSRLLQDHHERLPDSQPIYGVGDALITVGDMRKALAIQPSPDILKEHDK